MKTYKISLKIHGGFLTPFQADTLFGHLCWVVAHRRGEEGLREFLEPFVQGKPPFVISDGFPEQLLPKPLSADFIMKDIKERKELKKTDFVTCEDFESLREGKECRLDVFPNPYTTYMIPHNRINRLTNSTSKEGGVYSLRTTVVPQIIIYLKAISEDWKNKTMELFEELSKAGYGRKKSIGIGRLSINEVREFEFKRMEKPGGFVSLSNFCPAESDPTEGFYKTFVKYGKLGEEFTSCGNPFKRPLLMIKAGGCFKTDGTFRENYGRIIHEGVAPAKPEVVQYAYAFALPIVYPVLAS